MTTESPYETSKNSYLDFVQKKFPENEETVRYIFAKIMTEELPSDDHALATQIIGNIMAADLQPNPRVVHSLSQTSNNGPVARSLWVALLERMTNFICEAPTSNRKILIFWGHDILGFDNNHFDGFILRTITGTVAAATFITPGRLLQLFDWTTKYHDMIRKAYGPNWERFWSLTERYDDEDYSHTLDLISCIGHEGTIEASSSHSSAPTLRLPCIGVDLIEIVGEQPDSSNTSIYIMTRAPIKPVWPTGSFNDWVLSFASPEALIIASAALELDFMINSWQRILEYIIGGKMNNEVFALSRCLRLLVKTFTRTLDNWEHRVDTRELLMNLEKFKKDIELYEPDVQDAYRISVDQETLREARKSIEMSKKSIEMSEKSIKESERVRVLTIIASIFLPISLASSIFGMNVTLISAETTPFYAFIVTSVALCVGTLSIWAGSSIFLRYQKMRRLRLRASSLRLVQLALISWFKREEPSEGLLERDLRKRGKCEEKFP